MNTTMDKLLIDTCIVSYLLKKHPLAQPYLPLLQGKLLYLSFMTVAELFRWAEQHAWGETRLKQLKYTIQNYTVLHSDSNICWYWAKVRSIKGRPMPEADAWIAATALRYDLPLLTHNVKDFEHLQSVGLHLISVPSS